jgi:hypothetical protein
MFVETKADTMDVVLDTNAYRRLTFGKSIKKIKNDFSAITGSERGKGFRVFIAPVPYIELFGHLVDPEDPALDHCLKAVVGCYYDAPLKQGR